VNGKEWRFTDELEWIVPATLLTSALAAFTLAELPHQSDVLSSLLVFPLWLLAALSLAGAAAVPRLVKMMRSGVAHPAAHCAAFVRENAAFLTFVAFGIVLAGLNMISFMWVKPLLNTLVPFWADPFLASLDRAIFGTDPWRLLGFLNTTALAYFYHRAWFALMVGTLLLVLVQPSSREKSALMLTYFLLWSVLGPVIHVLLPAAGPVFYAQLGYGGAFSGLAMEPETKRLAGYLWSIYAGHGFGPGAGISAMPSLHIATTAWMLLAVYRFAPRWLVPMTAAGLLIFLLSISLGWHYAVDGIAGAAGAWGLWRMSLAVFSVRLAAQQPAMRSV
jgi:hypothetical protein